MLRESKKLHSNCKYIFIVEVCLLFVIIAIFTVSTNFVGIDVFFVPPFSKNNVVKLIVICICFETPNYREGFPGFVQINLEKTLIKWTWNYKIKNLYLRYNYDWHFNFFLILSLKLPANKFLLQCYPSIFFYQFSFKVMFFAIFGEN